MTAIEELGLTEEKFNSLYDEYGGFNSRFNKNAPVRTDEESIYDFMRKGARSLVQENTDLVSKIARSDD